MSENENIELDKHIKCVNFDLSTIELKKHFGSNTAKAYEQIAKFFYSKGFDKQQYSGYISKTPLNDTAVILLMKELGAKFTWLKDCIQQFDVSNAPDNLSQVETIRNSAEKAQKKQLTKLETLTQKLDREVKYYNEHQNSLYQDAKIRSQNTIIALCNELMQNGVTIDNKNVKVLQAIINERNGGKSL